MPVDFFLKKTRCGPPLAFFFRRICLISKRNFFESCTSISEKQNGSEGQCSYRCLEYHRPVSRISEEGVVNSKILDRPKSGSLMTRNKAPGCFQWPKIVRWGMYKNTTFMHLEFGRYFWRSLGGE
jgi:hypothetical protein